MLPGAGRRPRHLALTSVRARRHPGSRRSRRDGRRGARKGLPQRSQGKTGHPDAPGDPAGRRTRSWVSTGCASSLMGSSIREQPMCWSWPERAGQPAMWRARGGGATRRPASAPGPGAPVDPAGRLGVLAISVIYLGGPTSFILGLPPAVGALLLGVQSLALGGTPLACVRPASDRGPPHPGSAVRPPVLMRGGPAGTWP